MKNNKAQGGKVFFFQFEIPLRGMEFSHLVICGGFNELVIGSVSCRRFIHLCIFHSPAGESLSAIPSLPSSKQSSRRE